VAVFFEVTRAAVEFFFSLFVSVRAAVEHFIIIIYLYYFSVSKWRGQQWSILGRWNLRQEHFNNFCRSSIP
jgi:hypothetical protein